MLDSMLHEPNTGPPVELKIWWGNAYVVGIICPISNLHNWNRILSSDKIVGDPGPSICCPNPGAHVPIRAGVPATSKNGQFETTQMSLFNFLYHKNKVTPVNTYVYIGKYWMYYGVN